MIKRAAWLRDQILEFHLPFPRTYNWPWNCDSIVLWYCPNTSAKEKRSSQNIHIRQNIHIIHYVNVKCPFSPFRTLNSDFAPSWKFRNFSTIILLMMKIFIVFEIWPIKLESLISFRWQNIGSVQQEKQKRRKSKQEIKSTKSNFKCILIWNPYLSFNLCFYTR